MMTFKTFKMFKDFCNIWMKPGKLDYLQLEKPEFFGTETTH
jgi:hypothetical protein